MAAQIPVWTNQANDLQYEFHLSQQNEVTAHEFRKDLQDDFADTGLRIHERNIEVQEDSEGRRVSTVAQLTLGQKQNLLRSLDTRVIETERDIQDHDKGTMLIGPLG